MKRETEIRKRKKEETRPEKKRKMGWAGKEERKKKKKKEKEKKEIKELNLGFDLLTSPSPIIVCFTTPGPCQPAHLLRTPILAQVQAQSLWALTIHYSQAQSDLGPEESKAQLKWAPATSKDGSDYDPPSPVTKQLSSPPAPEEQCPFSWTPQ
jgi:hypothetical protein